MENLLWTNSKRGSKAIIMVIAVAGDHLGGDSFSLGD